MSNDQCFLVTGASGTIGRAFLEELAVKQNLKVRAQVRNKRATRASIGQTVDLTKVDLVEADFTRCLEQDYEKLVSGIDTIIHAGGLVHNPNATYQEFDVVNTRATLALAQAASLKKVQNMIFLSTAGVYGNGPFTNITETSELKPVTPYASSKLACENVLKNFTNSIPNIIIFRIGLVYGPGDRGNVLTLIKEIKHSRYLQIGKGDTLKSMIYANDVAKAILNTISRSSQNPGFNIYNLANPNPVSIKILTEDIAQILKISKKIQSLPEPLISFGVKAAQALLREKSPVSVDQLKKLTTTTTLSMQNLQKILLSIPQTQLTEGLEKEITWAKQNNLI